ncbi:unnamed protein product [Rhizophagus irregularis]|nr:unnamed protein product [Rhizophagus irregularis]CAB4427757.1 unnamed protein product [Rhizophagus irregularis]
MGYPISHLPFDTAPTVNNNFIRYTAHCISACDENLVNTALIKHMTMITIFSANIKCAESNKKEYTRLIDC